MSDSETDYDELYMDYFMSQPACEEQWRFEDLVIFIHLFIHGFMEHIYNCDLLLQIRHKKNRQKMKRDARNNK